MKRVKKLLPVALLLLSAMGCKVGEIYERPDPDINEKYYGSQKLQDSILVGEKNIAKINWKDFFNDSVLNGLIDSALFYNIALQKADKQVEIGFQNLKQSKANFFPSIGSTPFGYTREHYSENFNNFGSNRSRRNHGDSPPRSMYTENLAYQTSIFASWELDIWGKFRWQKKAAQADFMQTQEFKKAVQTALVAEIASTYFNMLMLKSQLTVSKKNFELSKNTLRIIKLQYDAGETTSLAIQQTESQMLRAKALIPQLENAYTVQETRMNRLLGRHPQSIEISQQLGEITFDSSYSTGVPLELIQNRPDVAAAEYNLIVSNAKVGIAEAMKYPSITINGGTGLNSFQFNNLLDPVGSGFALVNGALFQPIFQQRKLKTNHQISLVEKQIAELDFKDKVITAVGEVSNALVNIEKLQEEYEIAEDRLKVTTKGVKDAFLLFQSGFANYLEIINAQEDALESQLEVVRLKMHLALANIELYRSLGGGWQ